MCNERNGFDNWQVNFSVEEYLTRVIKYVQDLQKENETLKKMNAALQEKLLGKNEKSDDNSR
jgi:cell division septum initiation protein DivIVA